MSYGALGTRTRESFTQSRRFYVCAAAPTLRRGGTPKRSWDLRLAQREISTRYGPGRTAWAVTALCKIFGHGAHRPGRRCTTSHQAGGGVSSTLHSGRLDSLKAKLGPRRPPQPLKGKVDRAAATGCRRRQAGCGSKKAADRRRRRTERTPPQRQRRGPRHRKQQRGARKERALAAHARRAKRQQAPRGSGTEVKKQRRAPASAGCQEKRERRSKAKALRAEAQADAARKQPRRPWEKRG